MPLQEFNSLQLPREIRRERLVSDREPWFMVVGNWIYSFIDVSNGNQLVLIQKQMLVWDLNVNSLYQVRN